MAGTIPLPLSMTLRPICSKRYAIMSRLAAQAQSRSLPKRWTGCVSGRRSCGWRSGSSPFFHKGVESPIGYLRNERIEVIDEDRVHGVAGVLRPLHNEHEPMRG